MRVRGPPTGRQQRTRGASAAGGASAASPSAENTGERDLLGKKIGGTNQKHFPGVTVKDWRMVGGYAIQFDFSDGHNTGLYTFDYLKALG